jgi:hypothetical protein
MSKIILTFIVTQRILMGTRDTGSHAMFTYSQVEGALASAFSIRPEAMGAFRGRINHFRRLGLVPSSPGKGRKILYEREHVYKWALSLELAEFGIDPKLIKFNIEQFVWRYARMYLLEDSTQKDKLLVFYHNMLSGFGQYKEKQIVGGLLCSVVDNLAELAHLRENSPGEIHYELLSNRLGMINLGRLRRAVESGLKSD